MSNTYAFEVPGFGVANIVVNPDWKGPAKLRWKMGEQEWREVEIPGEVLQALHPSAISKQVFEERFNKAMDGTVTEVKTTLKSLLKKADEFVNKL